MFVFSHLLHHALFLPCLFLNTQKKAYYNSLLHNLTIILCVCVWKLQIMFLVFTTKLMNWTDWVLLFAGCSSAWNPQQMSGHGFCPPNCHHDALAGNSAGWERILMRCFVLLSFIATIFTNYKVAGLFARLYSAPTWDLLYT